MATELERLCAGFQPFSGMTLVQFTDFLTLAETYQREGTLKGGAKPRGRAGAAVDAGKVERAAQQFQQLYEQATDPTLEHTAIASEMKKLEKQLSKDEAIAVAVAVGIVTPLKTKKAAIDELTRKVTTRKDSYNRASFS